MKSLNALNALITSAIIDSELFIRKHKLTHMVSATRDGNNDGITLAFKTICPEK